MSDEHNFTCMARGCDTKRGENLALCDRHEAMTPADIQKQVSARLERGWRATAILELVNYWWDRGRKP